MDTIRLSSFHIQATHGCYEEEKKTPQTFVVDIECVLDFLFSTNDDLRETINYEHLRSQVITTFAQSPRNLIETLAVDLAEKILLFQGVHSVRVKIAKPDIWKDSLPSVEVMRTK